MLLRIVNVHREKELKNNMEHNLPNPLIILSLSGTFGIHTGLSLNPKIPKEPSSPSRCNARTEKHSAKIETDILKINKGRVGKGEFHP